MREARVFWDFGPHYRVFHIFGHRKENMWSEHEQKIPQTLCFSRLLSLFFPFFVKNRLPQCVRYLSVQNKVKLLYETYHISFWSNTPKTP